MKKFTDVTLGISNAMPVWPGDPEVHIRAVKSILTDGFAVSEITIGSHTGTHIDAPSHFIKGGKDVDGLDLSRLIGPCLVLDFSSLNRSITAQDVSERLSYMDEEVPERIIFKTGHGNSNSSKGVDELGIGEDTAKFLLSNGCKLVCIDLPSIEPESSNMMVHERLLGSEVIIMESLALDEIEEGQYFLISLPLKIVGADAAPCRAILASTS